MRSFGSSICYLDQEKEYDIEEASGPCVYVEREYRFLQCGGWVFWVVTQIVSGGVHGPRFLF